MHQIIAAIGAALRAMARTVWVTYKRTGRLIMQMIPDIGATAPAPTAVQRSFQRPSNDNDGRQVREPTGAALAVKHLAQRMASDTFTMDDMDGVDADVVEWMASLDHQQLCRLICVEDLPGYMSGRKEVRGLPPYLQHVPRPAERRTAERDLAYAPIAAPAI